MLTATPGMTRQELERQATSQAPGSSGPSQFGADYDAQSKNRLYGTQYFDANYERYMSFIDQFKDNEELYNRLKDLFQFTAYSPSNKESFWGDTSGIQDYYNQAFGNAMQAAQQIVDEYNQRDYNSPSAQVAREKAAGLNPALNGGQNISPGTAGDATPEGVVPAAADHTAEGADTALQTGLSFAQLGMNFMTGITSLIGGVQQLGLNYTQRGLLQTSLADMASDVALKEEARKFKYPTKEDGTVDYSAVPDLIVPSTSIKGRPKGAAGKALERARGNLYDENGKPTSALMRAIRDYQAGAVENQGRIAHAMADAGFSESIEDYAAGYSQIIVQKQIDALDWDNKLRKLDARLRAHQGTIAGAEANVAEALNSAELESAQAQAKSDKAIAEYNAGYYTQGLGEAKSTAESLLSELDAIDAEISKEQESTWKEIQDFISDPVHGKVGKYGIILMPGLRQEVDEIFERRHQAVERRRERLRNLGDSATQALIGSISK